MFTAEPQAVCGRKAPGNGPLRADAGVRNRQAKKGRKITLNIAVACALGATAARPDPVFALTGGPGESAILEGEPIVDAYAGLRRDRDIVLVDQLGTGKYGFDCDIHGRDAAALFGPGFPINDLRACRDLLSKKFDLTQYTTANFIDDLDDVRKALGYEKINLIGGSVGSRAVFVYLRRHPEPVRSAAVTAVCPPSVNLTAGFARGAETSLQQVFSACEADPACATAFPNPQNGTTTSGWS